MGQRYHHFMECNLFQTFLEGANVTVTSLASPTAFNCKLQFVFLENQQASCSGYHCGLFVKSNFQLTLM